MALFYYTSSFYWLLLDGQSHAEEFNKLKKRKYYHELLVIFMGTHLNVLTSTSTVIMACLHVHMNMHVLQGFFFF
jgi:hypothetical protein